jgi:hypothetical protein
MANTIALQKRISQVGAFGGAEYKVETYVSERGDLPDSGVFLLEILDANDPSLDTLARIATVADLSTYRVDRVQAVRSGERFFRSSATTVTYTDLNVAQTAVEVLKDFINRLVVAIQQFNLSFSTEGEPGPPEDYTEIEFPLVSAAIEERLVEDYRVKKQAVADLQVSVEAKSVECTSLSAQLTTATTQLAELRDLQSVLGDLDTQLQASVTAFGTLFTDGEDFAGKVDTGIDVYMTEGLVWSTNPSTLYFNDPNRDISPEAEEGEVATALYTFNGTMRSGRQELSKLNQRILALTTTSNSVTGQVTLKEAEVTTLESDGEKCATEKRVLDADLAAAQVDLQLAEDAILAVCPDFDLDSVETT